MACGDILAEDEGATAAAPHWRTAFQIATDLGERCGALWRLLGENPDAPEATSELIEQCRDRAAKKRAQGAAAELRELDRRKACEERCRDDYEQCAAFAKRSEVRSCATTETACLTGCQG